MRGPEKILLFERVTLALSCVTLTSVLAAWAFMRADAFSLGHVASVAGVVALAATALLWFTRMWAGGPPKSKRTWRIEGIAAGLCLGFGLLYACFPTYFLLGGQDPGPYLAFAARVAKTGGLHLNLPAIEAWAHIHSPAYVRPFPAVYGLLTDPHAQSGLQPQFVHFFTAYEAIFFALGGIECAVRANAWLAVLCLATGFSLLRRIASRWVAFAFVIALGINPAFVWASRITLTETLGLWLNLCGLLVLAVAWDRKSPPVALAAGVLFGVGVLNRLDGGLGCIAILGFAVAALLGTPAQRSAAAAAAFGHLATSLPAYRDAYLFAPVYYDALSHASDSLRILPWLTSGVDGVALAIGLVPAGFIAALRLNETRVRIASYAAVWVAFGWVAFGLTLRPLSDPTEDGTLVHQLTWYVGWACWPLAFGGLALALRAHCFERWLPLVALLLATLLIYTARTDAAPVHIWASRRWVPQVIPLMLATAALATDWLWKRRRPGRVALVVPALIGVAWLGPPLNFDRPFLFRTMLDGLPEAYERVAEFARAHRDKWPAVTDHVHLASILSYVYDVPTILLNDDGITAFERGEFAGGLAVGINPLDRHDSRGVVGGYIFPYLTPTKTEPPDDVGDARHAVEIGVIGPQVFSVDAPASHPAFRWQVSDIQPDGSVVSNGQRGRPLYGPWVTLEPGHYRVEWYGWVESAPKDEAQGNFDVISRTPKRDIADVGLDVEPSNGPEALLGAVEFTLDGVTHDTEFRARVERGVKIVLTRVHLQRFDDRMRASAP